VWDGGADAQVTPFSDTNSAQSNAIAIFSIVISRSSSSNNNNNNNSNIDTSAFSMVHDIKVLNLTAKTASRKVAVSLSIPLPLSLSFALPLLSMALNPCAHN